MNNVILFNCKELWPQIVLEHMKKNSLCWGKSTTFLIFYCTILIVLLLSTQIVTYCTSNGTMIWAPSSIWMKNEYMSRLEMKMFQINLFLSLVPWVSIKRYLMTFEENTFLILNDKPRSIRFRCFFLVNYSFRCLTWHWMMPRNDWPNQIFESNKEEWTILNYKIIKLENSF